jgi:hypothetical protein
MRWKSKDKFAWRDWFAWYPIKTVCGTNVWLEYVERRISETEWEVLPYVPYGQRLPEDFNRKVEYRLREIV